jgi:DNA polymerase
MPLNVQREANLFLKALLEEGIQEIYLPSVSSPGALTSSSRSAREELLELRERTLQCTLCQELAATRKSVVFGAGNIKAKLMFVGEAPGHDEDIQGLPFVGRAGQLLTKIIESIGLDRKQVFIGNVLKCRPPGNRAPQPDEILNCQPYLWKQIELIKPKIICALGTFAAQTLLKTGQAISQLRGRFHDYPAADSSQGLRIKVICTFHPAYLLRNPGEKRKVWEDMKMIKKELESQKGQETGDRGQETGDRGQETGDRGQETGDRGQETGDRGQETRDKRKEKEKR